MWQVPAFGAKGIGGLPLCQARIFPAQHLVWEGPGGRMSPCSSRVCRAAQGSGSLWTLEAGSARACLCLGKLDILGTGGCGHSGGAHLAPGTWGGLGTSSTAAQRPAGRGAAHLLLPGLNRGVSSGSCLLCGPGLGPPPGFRSKACQATSCPWAGVLEMGPGRTGQVLPGPGSPS